MGSGPVAAPGGGGGESLERVGVEVLAHVLRGDVPDREQHALALMVAGAILVRLAEISKDDGSVNRRDDVREPDLGGRFGQDVSAADASLRPDESRTFEGEKNLLQIGLGEPCAFGNVSDGGGTSRLRVEGEGQECPAGVVTSGRNAHGPIVGAGLEP